MVRGCRARRRVGDGPLRRTPVLLGELRAGLAKAAEEAGSNTSMSRWFLARRNALPGEDLPENPEYLPL